MVTDSTPLPQCNRVILVPAGTDTARIAAQVFASLPLTGRRLVVRGSVLRARIMSMLASPSRAEVVSYLDFNRELWQRSIGGEFQRLDAFNPDLSMFIKMAATRLVPKDLNLQYVVVAVAQQHPPDFYWLLRMLGVITIALVDAVTVHSSESNHDQICTALGCEPMRIEEPTPSTTEIHKFVAALAEGAAITAHESDRNGPLPILLSHGTPEEEASTLAELIKNYTKSRVGVLLHDAESVRAYRNELIAAGLDGVRSYLSKEPRSAAINWNSAGVTVLTWSSAVGARFDIVVLPCLDSVDDYPPFNQTRRAFLALAETANDHLVLSYSGSGRPAPLAVLPAEQIDDRTGDTVPPQKYQAAASISALSFPAAKIFEVPGPFLTSGRTVSTADIDAALALLESDRYSTAEDRTRRILTAAEEAGLAWLMRRDDVDISGEFLKKHRDSLPPNDLSRQAFDAFVVHNLRLVHRTAREFAHRATFLEADDLAQIGVTGLIRAIEKFDATRGNKFSTYATHWIKQAVTRGIYDFDKLIRLPVHFQEGLYKTLTTKRRLDNIGAPITDNAIAAECGISPIQVKKYLRWTKRVLSIESEIADTGDYTLKDTLSEWNDLNGAARTSAEQRSYSEWVHFHLQQLEDRERTIIEMRNGLFDSDAKTLDYIGQKFNLSRERIRQIENTAMKKLRKFALGGAAKSEHLGNIQPIKRNKRVRPITNTDLFLDHHPRSQDLGTERLVSGNVTVTVTPHVLPHPVTLAAAKEISNHCTTQWIAAQGFYLCFRDQPPIHVRWLGLPGLDNSNETALARIAVEIETKDMTHWGVTQDSVLPKAPEPFRGRLYNLAEMARERSRYVVQAHGPIASSPTHPVRS